MKYFLFLFSAFFMVSAANHAPPPKKRTIYAGTIANKNFVVGARNPGTGLFTVSEDGKNIENIGFKNMRTFSLEVYPKQEKGLIYCANGNGFFVTKNNGIKWRVTTDWKITEILEVAAVPKNPKITYIGSAYGLYKSTEFGENFKQLKIGFVTSLAIDNKNSDRIYLGQEDGLYISENAGKSFTKVTNLNYSINVITQDPKNQNRLYVGTEDDGIFISENHGNTWKQATSKAKDVTIYEIIIDSKNPKRIFVATFEIGILRSDDQGKTWKSFSKGLEDISVYDIAIHPDKKNILYAGTANMGILQSKDNGESWHEFAMDGSHVFDIKIK